MENPVGLEAPFNPESAVRELAGAHHERTGRKLSFSDQCALFYAVMNRIPPRTVAKTFAVTMTTVSLIGGCLARDPRPRTVEMGDGSTWRNRDMNANRNPNRVKRYRRVANEFERLGEEEFARRYYTHDIHTRLMRVKHDIGNAARPGRGPNLQADKHAGRHDFPDWGVSYDIVVRDDPPGWYIEGESNQGHFSWGREQLRGAIGREPFASSTDALDGIWELSGFPKGRLK
jgi:hypothetical protein